MTSAEPGLRHHAWRCSRIRKCEACRRPELSRRDIHTIRRIQRCIASSARTPQASVKNQRESSGSLLPDFFEVKLSSRLLRASHARSDTAKCISRGDRLHLPSSCYAMEDVNGKNTPQGCAFAPRLRKSACTKAPALPRWVNGRRQLAALIRRLCVSLLRLPTFQVCYQFKACQFNAWDSCCRHPVSCSRVEFRTCLAAELVQRGLGALAQRVGAYLQPRYE